MALSEVLLNQVYLRFCSVVESGFCSFSLTYLTPTLFNCRIKQTNLGLSSQNHFLFFFVCVCVCVCKGHGLSVLPEGWSHQTGLAT